MAMDITKKSLERKIKSPDLLIHLHPYALINTNTEKEENSMDNILSNTKEEKEIFLNFDIIKNEILNFKFQDLILDSNYDLEILNANKSNYNNNSDKNSEDDFLISRLNFLENNNTEIYQNFPNVYLLIPENEILKENASKLYEFLKLRNIKVNKVKVLESSDGFLSFDKLSENGRKYSVNYALKIILDFFLASNNEEIKLNKLNRIKSNQEMIKSVSSFSTLTNL